MHDAVVKTTIELLIQGLGENLISIAFHGSRARGDYRPDSDYDFFIVVDDTTSNELLQRTREEVNKCQELTIQIHATMKTSIHNDPANFIQLQSIRQGKILYDKDDFLKNLMARIPKIPFEPIKT